MNFIVQNVSKVTSLERIQSFFRPSQPAICDFIFTYYAMEAGSILKKGLGNWGDFEYRSN